MRNDVLLVIKDTLEDAQNIKVLSLNVEDNIVFGVYVNDVRDSLSFLSLPKNNFETVINGINIQFFELGTVLYNIYFNGALKFLDILYPSSEIIERNSQYINLCDFVCENIPFNVAKLKYLNALNNNFDYGTDIEKVQMLMDVANELNIMFLVWHSDNMDNFLYVQKIENESDFVDAYNSLNSFKEWLQDQKFEKISEKNINAINDMYVEIQIAHAKL